MKALVECIPNFSEGRRPEVIQQILESIRDTPSVVLLDHSSDSDHNRTVVTFVGDPAGVEEAAFSAIETAAQLIDMTRHKGEHPRIGATDVVPFVPIRGIEMDECVAIARRLGQRVGEQLNIPVYLYEAAASSPDRENLATIRKGQYEGLRDEIATNAQRSPDFGPNELGSPGATVIGARAPLVAYNIYLDSDDVDTANKIARAVRHSGGGLRFVKAMGVLVDGQAQVSMNLTDYTRTPIFRVQEMVRREAARYGMRITHAELVGLVPEQALIETARWYLQLDLFKDDQILERQLQAAQGDDAGVESFLDAVASDAPTPGGGSVAALAGALAAALAAMVARTTIGKKKYAEFEADMQAAAQSAEKLRASLTQAIAEDAQAFDAVMSAYRLVKEDPGRAAAIQQALQAATDSPLNIARLALEALGVLKIVSASGNSNAVTDAGSGAHIAHAAIEAAALNVRINTGSLSDEASAQKYLDDLHTIRQQGQEQLSAILESVEKRAGF